MVLYRCWWPAYHEGQKGAASQMDRLLDGPAVTQPGHDAKLPELRTENVYYAFVTSVPDRTICKLLQCTARQWHSSVRLPWTFASDSPHENCATANACVGMRTASVVLRNASMAMDTTSLAIDVTYILIMQEPAGCPATCHTTSASTHLSCCCALRNACCAIHDAAAICHPSCCCADLCFCLQTVTCTQSYGILQGGSRHRQDRPRSLTFLIMTGMHRQQRLRWIPRDPDVQQVQQTSRHAPCAHLVYMHAHTDSCAIRSLHCCTCPNPT